MGERRESVHRALWVLSALELVIAERHKACKEGREIGDSYTHSLFVQGEDAQIAKFLEETRELVESCRSERSGGTREQGADGGLKGRLRSREERRDQRREVIHEACDVVYHLLVLLRARDVALSDVCAELERRRALSGLEEKRTRAAP